MASVRKIRTPAHLDFIICEKVVECVYNLRASHSSAVIATSEHCSATIRGRQDLIDQCSLVGDCIRGILLIQELGIVEMIGGLAGIDITGFQILAY